MAGTWPRRGTYRAGFLANLPDRELAERQAIARLRKNSGFLTH